MENDQGPMAASAAVEHIIREISCDSARLKAKSKENSIFFQINAAKAAGYEEPFTAEQRAMNTILTDMLAGNACCEQAWQMFRKLTTGS